MAKRRTRDKEYQDINVYDEALNRVRYLYDQFDEVIVSFSGGKDSTAVLNITLEVARERNRLPLRVVYFDEEVVHPPTIEYVRRVANMEEIEMEWYCLEIQHRNAASNASPFWYTWDKENKDLWVRELPEDAITEHPRFKKGMTIPDFGPYLYERDGTKIAMLTGIRTEESLRRLQVITSKKNDSYIQAYSANSTGQTKAHPIYDWSSEDVWLAVTKNNWDYNKTYDLFNKTKLYGNYLQQRVCPPFGEEPLRGLFLWAECFPELWHKMLNRVPGVSTAWRYANTDLYSRANRPEHMTYKEYLNVILDSYDVEYRNKVKRTINKYIKRHRAKTDDRIEEEEVHPVSGMSYEFLCRVAIRGDFKGRQMTFLIDRAIKKCKKLGITPQEAMARYGKA